MKLTYLLFGMMTLNALATDEVKTLEGELAALKSQRQEVYDKYKAEHPEWKKFPNDGHVKFFTEWSNANLSSELELRKKYCEQDKKNCLSDKEREGLEAQTQVAIKVAELRNDYAKTNNPTPAEQAHANKEIERAGNVNLCQKFGQNCEQLAQKDRDLVEYLKQRDARIAGMEAEFAIGKPDWKEKKGDKEVMNFLLRREGEFLALNLKLNDVLCHQYPKDLEFCFTDNQIEDLKLEAAKVSCQHERINHLYNIAKEDLADKEKILIAGHAAQWDSLPKKDCKFLMAQDRIGEGLAPAPVAAPGPVEPAPAPKKEEVFGDNEDEKNPRNFKPETCRWVNDLPRKLSFLPGCGGKGACVGFVVCDRREGEGKFVRTSTCAPKFCGASDSDAVSCTKQGGYYTKKAKEETKEFVSEKLKRIFSTGVIKQ